MQTLVLTRDYQPWAKISWQDAFVLLAKNRAEIVETYDDKVVRTVTLEFKVPSIIRFLQRVVGKKRFPKFSRENIWARDGGRCGYCNVKLQRNEFTYDHVVPRSQGGKTDWLNVVATCAPCNQKKGGRTPEQARMKLLRKPCRPDKLGDVYRVQLVYRNNEPPSWKQFLIDNAYWNGELDES